VEIALANEADVADFNESITSPWVGFPKGVAISRILGPEFFTVDIVVHQGRQEGMTEKERSDRRYDKLVADMHVQEDKRGRNESPPKRTGA
jgi:hypothetical protein